MLKPGYTYHPAQVLPHAGSMLLLDEISAYGEDWLEAAVNIHERSAFAGAGGVPAWAGVEYMAQAVCAWSGIEQVQRGDRPTIGLLLGTRRYQSRLPLFTGRLRVRAQMIWRDAADLGAFDCEISSAAGPLASAQLKVYRPRDVEKFLRTGTQ